MSEFQKDDGRIKENIRMSTTGVIYLENTGLIRHSSLQNDPDGKKIMDGLIDIGIALTTYAHPSFQLPYKARISWEQHSLHHEKVLKIVTAVKSSTTTTLEMYSLLKGPVRQICEIKGFSKIYTLTQLPREHMIKLGWIPLWERKILGIEGYTIDIQTFV